MQPAVYWAPEGADGYGGIRYSAPREVKVRWEDKVTKVSDGRGEEIISRAVVLSPDVMEERGMLWLGSFQDLEAVKGKGASRSHPAMLDDAYDIKRVDKTPLYRSATKFVRRVYL